MTRLEEYNAVREIFENYIHAWESGDVDQIDNCMIQNPDTDYSMFGPIYGREQLKQRLQERPRKVTLAKFDIENYVCLMENNVAQQSASICGLFADESVTPSEHLAFTGLMVNRFEKREEGWRIVNSKFDLLTDDTKAYIFGENIKLEEKAGKGDASFTSNWKPVIEELAVYDGAQLFTICAEMDSPWYAIKNRDYIGSDEDQIKEQLSRYAFGVDNNATSLIKDIFTEDADIWLNYLGSVDKRTAILMLQRSGSAVSRRCHHILSVKSMDITDDTAVGIAYQRSVAEPAPLGLLNEIEDLQVFDAYYRFEARKEEGVWRFSKFHIYPKSFIEQL